MDTEQITLSNVAISVTVSLREQCRESESGQIRNFLGSSEPDPDLEKSFRIRDRNQHFDIPGYLFILVSEWFA
jgi:hypothetical protein